MKHQYIKNGLSLKIDMEKCIGCQICTQVCPHNVFNFQNNKAIITNRSHCMECGACMKNCPVSAITVNTGVGCAAAIIGGLLKDREPVCGCSNGKSSCC